MYLRSSINHSTRSFNTQYRLKHRLFRFTTDVQTHMLKKHLEAHGPKIDNEKMKQKISEQLTEDLW